MKYGWPQIWFRDGLKEMAACQELEGLYAHTSMSTIVLSRFADWPAWRENSHIMIHPVGDTARVSLVNRPFERLRGPDVTEVVSPDNMCATVVKMLALAGW